MPQTNHHWKPSNIVRVKGVKTIYCAERYEGRNGSQNKQKWKKGRNRDGESGHWVRRHFKIIKAKNEKVKHKEYRGWEEDKVR